MTYEQLLPTDQSALERLPSPTPWLAREATTLGPSRLDGWNNISGCEVSTREEQRCSKLLRARIREAISEVERRRMAALSPDQIGTRSMPGTFCRNVHNLDAKTLDQGLEIIREASRLRNNQGLSLSY